MFLKREVGRHFSRSRGYWFVESKKWFLVLGDGELSQKAPHDWNSQLKGCRLEISFQKQRSNFAKNHPFQGSYYVEMISGQINILPRVIGSSQKPCLHCLALATIQSWDSWKGQQVCGLARNRVVDKSVSFHLKLVLNPRWRNLQHISILSYAFCQDLKSIVLHFSPDSYHRMLLTMELLVFCLAIWSNFIFSVRDSLTRWSSFGDPSVWAFRFSSFRRSSSSVFLLSLAPFFFWRIE